MPAQPLLTPEEIVVFQNLGYCNVGCGRIARINKGGARTLFSFDGTAMKRAGINGYDLRAITDNRLLEHLWRLYGAITYAVGLDIANQFPDSATTMTHYVIGSPEEWEVHSQVGPRISRKMMADKAAGRNDGFLAMRQADYEARHPKPESIVDHGSDDFDPLGKRAEEGAAEALVKRAKFKAKQAKDKEARAKKAAQAEISTSRYLDDAIF